MMQNMTAIRIVGFFVLFLFCFFCSKRATELDCMTPEGLKMFLSDGKRVEGCKEKDFIEH